MPEPFHQPVLLQSVCAFLDPGPGRIYLDATLGGGGHTAALLAAGARVLAVDQDQSAIDHVAHHAAFQPALAAGQLLMVKSNFIYLKSLARENNFFPVDGLIADLGVSSHQLDTPGRGFSHHHPGPLDMRMDQSLTVSAADLLNTLPSQALIQLFRQFADLTNCAPLVNRLISHRPFSTTTDLSRLVPYHYRPQFFQALRIAVNDELGALNQLLTDLPELLKPGGVAVLISFHSLEDRLVKTGFKNLAAAGQGQVLTPSPISPGSSELETNPRSRSSKLRAFKKI